MSGTYVGLNVEVLDSERILKIVNDSIGTDLINMHVTLVYSPDDFLRRFEPRPDKKYQCMITGIDTLGEGKWQALVLKLTCPKLMRRHAAILKSFNVKHSYPTLTLHTTVRYGKNSLANRRALQSLIGTKITVSGEYVEPLED